MSSPGLHQVFVFGRTMQRAMDILLTWVIFAGFQLSCLVGAQSISDAQWTAAINMAGRQRMLSQRMSKAFLFVALDMAVDANKAEVLNVIALFDTSLSSLKNGSSDMPQTIVQAPNEAIDEAFDVVVGLWATYRSLLETTMDTVRIDKDTVNNTILMAIYDQNIPLLKKSNAAVTAYTDGARTAGASVAGKVLDVAGRQRMLSQKMSKEATFIGLNIMKAENLASLASTFQLFEDSHMDIIRGVGSLDDMPELTDVCTIAKMKDVSTLWNGVLPYFSSIIDNEEATVDALTNIMSKNVPLLTTMNQGVALYAQGTNECDLASSILADGWMNLLGEVGNQRMLGQETLALFTQAANGVNEDVSRVDTSTALTAGTAAMRVCIEGSDYSQIPSPPSQEIVDALFSAQVMWLKFSNAVSKALLLSDLANDVDFYKLAEYGDGCMVRMDHVADLIVNASLKAIPQLRSVYVEISWRQMILIQRMAKEAMLSVLAKDSTASTASMSDFATIVATFEGSHSELLLGRVVGAVADSSTLVLFADRNLAATTNACTLTLMMNILTNFEKLKGQLQQATAGGLEPEVQVSALTQAAATRKATSNDVRLAVSSYRTGTYVCDTVLPPAEWESGLQFAGKTAELLQRGMKDFVLIAGGAASVWMQTAQASLAAQRQYILEDVESPQLSEAVAAFKEGWFAIGKTDAERTFALKTAYITQNPNPEGSKNRLGFAPGPESYHAAHKKFHEMYRDLLDIRDYSDAYILDTQGSLIYSINKYEDFATNFEEKGNGDWKDSGLGEAYRLAKANQEILHMVDWSPYGPMAGAMANFLSKAIKSPVGIFVGVYATQLPPSSKPIDCAQLLLDSLASFDDSLTKLKFGLPAETIPPPATQNIADRLFQLDTAWLTMKDKLGAVPTVETVGPVLTESAAVVSAAAALVQAFVDDAWIANPSVPAMKISIANEQLARIQALARDAALLFMENDLAEEGVTIATIEEIAAAVKRFEDAHLLLTVGKQGRRLQKDDEYVPKITDVLPSTDPLIVKLMEDTFSSFSVLKATLERITGVDSAGNEVVDSSGLPVEVEGATVDSLKTLVGNTDEVGNAMDQSFLFLASKMDIVVFEPISVLAPMPFTGTWTGGTTMRLAARVAEGLINDEQIILPGYALTHVFFDDKCDPTVSSQIVLREMASATKYIGLGGSGCTDVCAGTAFVAASIRLPYLSYECAGAELADTTAYPDLTRFGTVTTPKADIIKELGSQVADWSYVNVVSGDPAKYRTLGENMVSALEERGINSQYSSAYDTNWEEIVELFDMLRMSKRRVIFVMGTESYFRKLICASIVVEANTGISWLSEGAWREDWWSKKDAIIDFHHEWIKEDSETSQLQVALDEFKRGWNNIADTDEERFAVLQPIYHTAQRDELMFVDSEEAYHKFHKKWHNTYRKHLVERSYFDIYMFDLKGNLVYSVFKDTDYATNFGTKKNLEPKFSEWQNSGLGDAFRGAMAEPDVVTATPWTPYGPAGGELASFLATGVRSEEGGALIGVYGTQMPPEAMSIDTIEPSCTLPAITESFEGAINFVGLGKPIAADVENQVPCFKGKTAKAFIEMLDVYFEQGYPIGDEASQISDPYTDIRGHTVDGACAFAYVVQHMMAQGLTLDEIETRNEEAYAMFISHIKTGIDFWGVSGHVKFATNDKPAYLAVQQVQEGSKVLVGTCSYNVSIDLTLNGGPSNASWKPSHPDVIPNEQEFPYWVFQIFLPILCICCPASAACIRNF